MINSTAKGNRFELAVWRKLEADGWLVGSRRKGPRASREKPGDLSASKLGERHMLVECTANKRSPWSDKGPAERTALREVAAETGAVPVIAWPGPDGPVLLDEAEWPS